jgi:hypothetical protein
MSAYFDLVDEIGVMKLDGLGKATQFWLRLLIHNYKNESKNPLYNWSNVLTKQELKELKETRKEILGKDEDGKIVTVYRVGNKIYCIKKFDKGIRKKLII